MKLIQTSTNLKYLKKKCPDAYWLEKNFRGGPYAQM